MIKTTLSLFLLVMALCASATRQSNCKELDHQLDQAISQSKVYVQYREKRISSLKKELEKSHNIGKQYQINRKLFNEYQSYINDSAIVAMEHCISLAQRMHRSDEESLCRSMLAVQCSKVGFYEEALQELKRVDLSHLTKEGREKYLLAAQDVYLEMAAYTKVKSLQAPFQELGNAYRDSLLHEADPHSDDYYQYKIISLTIKNDYTEALRVSDEWLKRVSPNDRRFAVAAYFRYTVYKVIDDKEQMEYWLLRSAICDITHAVMDQGALWTLVGTFRNELSIERQHQYINYSWDCSRKFSARLRSQQISPIMAIVNDSYSHALYQRNELLTVFVIAIIIIAVILLYLFYYVRQSNRRIRGKNEQLKTAYEHLKEANKLKETYIWHFFALCGTYIEKMEAFRHQTNKLLRDRKFDDLHQMLRSTDKKVENIKELYKDFDSTFLSLFPTFIDEFNQGLPPGQQQNPPQGELNTILRVFALVRLGIDDGSKIAQMLNLSINTVYNYRARIRKLKNKG